jgi:hypothetical protein
VKIAKSVLVKKRQIPSDVRIGKNVMVDAKVSKRDFSSLEIPSGFSVLKGGDQA